MLKVGLTGGIACGKTVVRERLASRGARTLDADAAVHELFREGGSLPGRIAKAFGSGVLASDGSVDRKALGKLVFADEAQREKLNALVHPEVWKAIEKFFQEALAEGEALAIVDAALMIETGSYRGYDRLVVVYCPRDLQLLRLIARDGLSREEGERRLNAQMDAAEKKLYADYLVDTSGNIAETLARADEVWKALCEEAQRQ